MRQQRVRSDVKRHAEKNISRALIKLARKSALLDVELNEAMAWRQLHLGERADVPRADNQAARVRVGLYIMEQVFHLVCGRAVGVEPRAPLLAVDGTELAVFVRPLVPDRDLILLEILNVGIAAQEP